MKKPKFSVVVPVVNTKLLETLFSSIEDNHYDLEKIILVDNTHDVGALEVKSSLFAEAWILKPKEPLPVNPSWEIGISLSGNVDFVTILNDDVILGPNFFERVASVFQQYQDAGAVCPHTLTSMSDEIPAPNVHRMKRREGWAFTMRKLLLDDIPPIPEGCHYFFGDTWFWWFTYRKFHMFWYKDTENIIWHDVGTSMRAIANRRTIKSKEKEICSQALRKYFGK